MIPGDQFIFSFARLFSQYLQMTYIADLMTDLEKKLRGGIIFIYVYRLGADLELQKAPANRIPFPLLK